MRSLRDWTSAAALAVFLTALSGWTLEALSGKDESDFGGPANYDDLLLGLVGQLSKSPAEAQDAAGKLARMGQRAVPVLADLLERAPKEGVKFYAAWALSHIRHPSAAKALLPILKDAKAARELRLMAIEAASGAGTPEAGAALIKLASEETDGELRHKALLALSVMPTAWRDCEQLFVACLDDPRDDIRSLGVQSCLYAAAVKIIFPAAEPKLLAMVEQDPDSLVRQRALTALTRMKSQRAVALTIRLLAAGGTPPGLTKQALSVCETLTGVPLATPQAALTWWEKFGKARYENAPALRPLVPPEKTAEAGPAVAKANDEAAPKAGGAPPTKASSEASAPPRDRELATPEAIRTGEGRPVVAAPEPIAPPDRAAAREPVAAPDPRTEIEPPAPKRVAPPPREVVRAPGGKADIVDVDVDLPPVASGRAAADAGPEPGPAPAPKPEAKSDPGREAKAEAKAVKDDPRKYLVPDDDPPKPYSGVPMGR